MRKLYELNLYKMQKFLFFVVLIVIFDVVNGNTDNNLNISTVDNLSDLKIITENLKSSSLSFPYLSLSEISLFEKGIENVQNGKCKRDLNTTLWAITEGLPWATAMYDSSVKVPNGIEHGQIYQFGSFDECINSADSSADNDNNQGIPLGMSAKYCLADVTMEGLVLHNLMTRKKNLNATIVHWAVCVPSSCHSNDIEHFMSSILGREIQVDDSKCYVKKPFEATRGMIIYGCIILLFVMMTLFSTIYHVFWIYNRKNNIKNKNLNDFEMIIKSFSFVENLNKLFQKSHDTMGLNTINGIKSIFMFLVIASHSALFILTGPIMNTDYPENASKFFGNAFMYNSPLYVDTFLLLSGFLFCRILLMELERRRGRLNVLILYIFRYIRLTPAYLAVIAFYVTWLPKIGSGPLWNNRIGLEKQRCENSWWLNLLYVNNYFGTDNTCMFQSWYLAVDYHLYILAPIGIYLLFKSRKAGISVLCLAAIVTSIIPFLITYLDKLDPTVLIYPDEMEDVSENYYFRQAYIKTHMRAVGYVAGLLTGFIVHYIQEKRIEIPCKLVCLLWATAAILGATSMFSVMMFYITSYSQTVSAMYAGLHRLGWSLANAWLIIATTTGHAGFLKPILASRFFAPLSRLTYCAYLTNGLVELYHVGTLRTPLYLDTIQIFGRSISHVVLTFLAAIILCLLFESPIHGIERILLRKDSQRRHTQKPPTNPTPSTSEETA